MLNVHQAVNKLLGYFAPLSPETIHFTDSLGRTLAEEIIADQPYPPFDNSSMDGYAVVMEDLQLASQDTPISLTIIEDIPAGKEPEKLVKPGQASKIMTGAKIPEGANAVIRVEDTAQKQEIVEIFSPVKFGENIRRAGENFAQDAPLLGPGHPIRPQEVALFATLGKTSVKVTQKPKIGLLITGDELVAPKQTLRPGQIRDSNSYMLNALMQNFAVDVVNNGIVEDSEEKIHRALNKMIEHQVDLIISTGGVSMGEYDYVRKAIEEKGTLEFWRVNIKPGKPIAFGYIEQTPIIGLPGNPVSSYVGYHVFILPVIRKLSGRENPSRLIIQAALDSDLRSNERESYIPATIKKDTNQYKVTPAQNQSSGNLYSLVQTNSLIILPGGVEFFKANDKVNVWIFDNNTI